MGLLTAIWLVGSYAEQVKDRPKSYPDWAGICEEDPTVNIVPGDSKFALHLFDIGHDSQSDKSIEEEEDVDSFQSDESMRDSEIDDLHGDEPVEGAEDFNNSQGGSRSMTGESKDFSPSREPWTNRCLFRTSK
ncbi:hypothetical protein QC760_010560 [Botrytis cinerea]